MALAVGREMFLVRAPAELARLPSLADEADHRPGVGELIALLARLGDLGVALGTMDDLDAELHRKPAHSSRVFGIFTSPETSRAIFTMR